MRSFLLFTIFILTLQLNLSSASTEDEEYVDNDYDYNVEPLDSLRLEDEDTDVHIIGKEDDLRQIIFNPRKRRERRKKHRGNYRSFFF